MVSDSYGIREPTESAMESSSLVRSDSETSRRATSERTRKDASDFSDERTSCTRISRVPLVPGPGRDRPGGAGNPCNVFGLRAGTFSAVSLRPFGPGRSSERHGRRGGSRAGRGFFDRPGLLAPAVLAPIVETALVRSFGSTGNAALAPQVTAPPPLDLFHDLRWISVFHDSWLVLALELAAVVILRSVWVTWMVQQAWPRRDTPSASASVPRVAVFYAIAIVLLTPWVILLFGQALVHVSFLFFAALPPAVALAVIIHRGAASQAAGRWWMWRPTWRSVAWVLGSFVWLTATGAVAGQAALPWAPAAAGLGGLANARAWYGVVQDVAGRPARRPLRALAPVLVGVIFAVTVGGTGLGFAARGHHAPSAPAGPPPAAEPGDHPVLIAAGLHSRFDPRPPLRLPGGYVGWRFSYRGVDRSGRPLPYGPADTQRSIERSALAMAPQVANLRRAYPGTVPVRTESEWALAARHFHLGRATPRRGEDC